MNVSLNPHFDRLIDDLVKSGSYNSASEVIRSALRLLEQEHKERKLKTEYYTRAIKEGLASGNSGFWDKEEFLKKAKKRALTDNA
jgi:antitoxin ParD1/3/4